MLQETPWTVAEALQWAAAGGREEMARLYTHATTLQQHCSLLEKRCALLESRLRQSRMPRPVAPKPPRGAAPRLHI
jgi:hypothetical protein